MESKTLTNYVAKKGYKGFDKDLKSSGLGKSEKVQFEIGKLYYKDNVGNPKVCSDQGYHYCNTLEQTFNHYKNDGNNRFCEVEILGNFSDTEEKSITTAIRIGKEISKEDLEAIREEEKTKKLESGFRLEEIRFLQRQNPFCHVGGSVALFLRGVRLKRWENSGAGDIDMVAPFFFQWVKEQGMDIDYKDAKASGNDFDETFILNDVKVDVRIDNTQRYEVITYKGFDYKVSSLENILEAKVRYAMNGQQKHKDDIRQLIGLK